MRTIIYLCLLTCVVCACDTNEDICLSNQQSIQGMFYSSYYDSDNETDTTVANISIVGLLNGEEVDSIIYNNDSIDNCYMPLSMFSDTTRYLVKIKSTSDTITFVHDKELSFISEDCGFIFKFNLDTVFYSTTSFIDSVAIEYKKIIYNETKNNVKIYIY